MSKTYTVEEIKKTLDERLNDHIASADRNLRGYAHNGNSAVSWGRFFINKAWEVYRCASCFGIELNMEALLKSEEELSRIQGYRVRKLHVLEHGVKK